MTTATDRVQLAPARNDVSSLGLLVLRVYTGGAVILHGLQQVHRMDDFANNVVRGLDVPLPVIAAWLTMLGELGLGTLLVLGLFTRPAGALLGVLFVSIFFTWYIFGPSETLTLRRHSGTLKGIESMCFAATGFVLASIGGGRFALDRSSLRRLLPFRSLDQPLHLLNHLRQSTAFVRLRVLVGILIVLHGLLQLERMADFTTRLGEGIGVTNPTFLAWLIVLGTIGVGILLAIGTYIRPAGFLLTALALVTCLAVRNFGGGIFDIGFNGEEYLIYAAMGIFFGCSGEDRIALAGG